MKKTLLLLSLTLLTLFSCTKKDVIIPDASQSNSFEEFKIQDYFKLHQDSASPDKLKGIQKILQSLDYSKLAKEDYQKREDIWVVPFQPDFKSIEDKTEKGLYALVVFAGKSGVIRTAKVVKYISQSPVSAIPSNTYHNLYTFNTLEVKGKFEFYNYTGKLYETFEYKDGQLKSHGIKKGKRHSSSSSTSPASNEPNASSLEFLGCIDWYMDIYTYTDGNLTSFISIFLGTTCYFSENEKQDQLEGGGGGSLDPTPSPGTPPSTNPYFNSWYLDPRMLGKEVSEFVTKAPRVPNTNRWDLYTTNRFFGIKDLSALGYSFYFDIPHINTYVNNTTMLNYFTWSGVTQNQIISNGAGPLGDDGVVNIYGSVSPPLGGSEPIYYVGSSSAPLSISHPFNIMFP